MSVNGYKAACCLLAAIALFEGLLLLRSPSPPLYEQPKKENRHSASEAKPVASHSSPLSNPTPPPAIASERISFDFNRLSGMKGVILRVPFIDAGSKQLGLAARELLDLTESEASSVNREISRASSQLAALRAQYATTKKVDASTLSINVQAFPEEGAAVYDNFVQNLKNELGEDTFLNLTALCSTTLESDFNHFGAEEATYTISRLKPSNADGAPQFHYQYKSDRGGERSSVSSSFQGLNGDLRHNSNLSHLVTPEALEQLVPSEENP